jgi:ribosomal protein S8
MKKLNFNYIIADIVSNLNIGILRKLRFIKLIKTNLAIRLLTILYKQGILRTFIIKHDHILVYFKFCRGQPLCSKLKLISKPSNRAYFRLGRLNKYYNNNNFSGFLIVSSQRGLVTSEYCLLNGHVGGELFIKVEV